MDIKEIEHEIIELQQKIQKEVNARKSISKLAEDKMYSIEKKENQILDEIKMVLELLKGTNEIPGVEALHEIEIIEFKNSIRQALKELELDTKARLDVMADYTSTNVEELSSTLKNLFNNKINEAFKNFKLEISINRDVITEVKGETENINSKIELISEDIKSNTKEITKVEKALGKAQSSLDSKIKKSGKESLDKIKAVNEFNTKKMKDLESKIDNLLEKDKKDTVQKALDQEKVNDHIKGTVKEELSVSGVYERLTALETPEESDEVVKLKVNTQEEIEEIIKYQKELKNNQVSTQDSINNIIKENKLLNTKIEVQDKKNNELKRTIEQLSDSIETHKNSNENALEKDIKNLRTSTSKNIQDSTKKINSTIKTLSTKLDKEIKDSKKKDQEIKNLQKSLKDTGAQVETLELELEALKESISLLLIQGE